MEMFKESNGQISMIRVLLFVVIIIIVLTWAIISILQGEMVDFSQTQLYAMGGSLLAKIIQKFAEGKPIEIDPKEVAIEISSHFKAKDK